MPIELTDDQIALYIETFYTVDADCDDIISRDELFQLLETVGLSIVPDELLNILKELKIDTNRIGKRELLRVAKVILDKKAQKEVQTPASAPYRPKKSFLDSFSPAEIQSKVSAFFEGQAYSPTSQSFFDHQAPTSATFSRNTSKVGDSSAAPPKNDYVVEIAESDDSESDYEYYSDSSDGSDTVVGPERRASETPSVSAAAGPSADAFARDKSKPRPEVGKPVKTVAIAGDPPPSYSKEKSANAKASRPPPQGRKPNGPSRNKSVRHQGRKTMSNGAVVVKSALNKPDSKATKAAALADPKVRKQLASIKHYNPNFLTLVTFIQVVMIAWEFVYNGGIEELTTNPFVGPSKLTLIQLGAKYGPCMKPDPAITADFYGTCHSQIPIEYKHDNGTCKYYDNLLWVCGLGGFQVRETPDQVWRFFIPVFLHSGVVHFLINLLIQLRVGFKMESQLGSVRMGLIYMICGVSGYIFAATMEPNHVSVGASGALYGLFALLYLDLFFNWPILNKKWQSFTYLTSAVLVALGIGLLPFIDNYTHIGGFIAGLFAGLIMMPTVYFSESDRRKKLALKFLSIPILVAGISLGLVSFYSEGTNFCPFCSYLNCIPQNSEWCGAET